MSRLLFLSKRAQSVTNNVPPWYLAGGVPLANCACAFQGIGQSTETIARVDLTGHGVTPATFTTSWAPHLGFIAAGGGRIDFGIVPSTGYAMIFRFSGAQSTTGITVGAEGNKFGITPWFGAGQDKIHMGSGGGYKFDGAYATSGVLGLGGTQGWKDGSVLLTGMTATISGAGNIWFNTGSSNYINLMGLAIYNAVPTDAQFAAIMNALAAIPIPTVTMYAALGDSKSIGYCADFESLFFSPTTNCQSLKNSASGYSTHTYKGVIDTVIANISAADPWMTPTFALLQLGTNDLGAMPLEADCISDYQYILDALNTKWSGIQCYLTKPWWTGHDTEENTYAGWVDTIVASRAFAHVGIDERVVIKPYANLTDDGKHPNAAGYAAEAAAWKTLLGL